MSVEDPILLPQMSNLLQGPKHPLVSMGSLTLAAWKVSGEISAVRDYQKSHGGCFRESCKANDVNLCKPLERVAPLV